MRRSLCATVTVMSLLACSSPTEPDLGGMPIHVVRIYGNLDIQAFTQLQRDTVVVTLVVTNRGTTAGRLEFGACSFAVQGVGSEGSWDNRLPPNSGCIDIGLGLELNARETNERVVLRASATELRGGRAPDTYNVTVYYDSGMSRDLARSRAGRIAF